MRISERTLRDLGFPSILKALESRCRTEPGRARASARPFLDTPKQASEHIALIQEARLLHSEPLSLPLGGISNLQPTLFRAQKGAMLEPLELVSVTHALFAFEKTLETLESRKARLPGLSFIAQRIPHLEKLATRLDRAFEPNGEISDRASPELKEARERTRSLHRTIRSRIDKLLHDQKFDINLQEPYFSVRHDRYVFPVQAQHRAQVPGIVHNASQSGQTLFIEPQELIGLGNELAIAQSLVLEEERRVLQTLSSAVGKVAHEIEEGILACAQLDEVEAAARLSEELQAQEPEIPLTPGDLRLCGVRHPLLMLQGTDVIRNDIELEPQSQALVVSGPNAGGKTITITAVGLCALMLRVGLPIPAETGSKMPWFEGVFSAIGDAQDLAQGLSTFSAHVKELAHITSQAGPASLVLIDEIAADTDPKEGAALAIAVLETLLSAQATVLVTTHLEELKALAHLDQRFVNARVGFDARKMAPTYRLQMGAAGNSSALDIAARMGMQPQVLDRARALLLGAGGPLANALTALDLERRELSEAKVQAQAAEQAAQTLRDKLSEEMRTFEIRRKSEELHFREALKAELEFAQTQVKSLLSKLHQQSSIQALENAKKELAGRLAEQTQAVAQMKDALRPPPPAAKEPFVLKLGAWVRHKTLERDMELIEINGEDVVVAAGLMRLRAKVSELAAPATVRPVSKFPVVDKAAQRLAKAIEVAPKALALGSSTLDVRGVRAVEAVRQIEAFMDRLSQSGEETALILHGLGSGALKHSVHAYLRNSPYAESFRPGDSKEGGDGVTVVQLRG